jgi:hypothetical protein
LSGTASRSCPPGNAAVWERRKSFVRTRRFSAVGQSCS